MSGSSLRLSLMSSNQELGIRNDERVVAWIGDYLFTHAVLMHEPENGSARRPHHPPLFPLFMHEVLLPHNDHNNDDSDERENGAAGADGLIHCSMTVSPVIVFDDEDCDDDKADKRVVQSSIAS